MVTTDGVHRYGLGGLGVRHDGGLKRRPGCGLGLDCEAQSCATGSPVSEETDEAGLVG